MATFPYLTPGDTFMFRGTEYVIVKVNPKNYNIATREGAQYRLNRMAPIEHTGRDTAWLREARKLRVEQNLAQSGMTADDPNAGVYASGLPRFTTGTRVRITGKGAGRFEGKTGTIAKVNRVRYSVAVDGMGKVNVPFTMAVREDSVPATPAPQNAQNELVGKSFRYPLGDAKVLFTVTEVDGKVTTAVGAKDDFIFGDTRIPSDYEGVTRDFLTADVEAHIEFEKKWAELTKNASTQDA